MISDDTGVWVSIILYYNAIQALVLAALLVSTRSRQAYRLIGGVLASFSISNILYTHLAYSIIDYPPIIYLIRELSKLMFPYLLSLAILSLLFGKDWRKLTFFHIPFVISAFLISIATLFYYPYANNVIYEYSIFFDFVNTVQFIITSYFVILTVRNLRVSSAKTKLLREDYFIFIIIFTCLVYLLLITILSVIYWMFSEHQILDYSLGISRSEAIITGYLPFTILLFIATICVVLDNRVRNALLSRLESQLVYLNNSSAGNLFFSKLELSSADFQEDMDRSIRNGNPKQSTPKSKGSPALKKEDIDTYDEILRHIHSTPCFTNPACTITSVSKNLDVPAYHIKAAIKLHSDMTFSKYINKLRVKEAKSKILSEEYDHLSFEAIGELVGFQSKSSFYRNFKKFENCTPSDLVSKINDGK